MNQMQQIGMKHWRVVRKYLEAWEKFFTLFFIVSGEQRITKQMSLVFLWILFFCKQSSILKIWGWRRNISPLPIGFPQDIAYNQKSYVIRLKTDNWQYATQLIVENL